MNRYANLATRLDYREEGVAAIGWNFGLAGLKWIATHKLITLEVIGSTNYLYEAFFKKPPAPAPVVTNPETMTETFIKHVQKDDIPDFKALGKILDDTKHHVSPVDETDITKVDQIYNELNSKYGKLEGWLLIKTNYLEFKQSVLQGMIPLTKQQGAHDEDVKETKGYLYWSLFGLLLIGLGFIYYDLKKSSSKQECWIPWTKNKYFMEGQSFFNFLSEILKKAIEFFKKIIDNKYGLISVGILIFCFGIYFLYTKLITNKS